MDPNVILGVVVLLLAVYRSVQLGTPGWRRRVRWGRTRNSAPVSAVAHACWLLMLYVAAAVLMGSLFGVRLAKEQILAIIAGSWVPVIVTALVDIVRWKLRKFQPPTDDSGDGKPPAESPAAAKR